MRGWCWSTIWHSSSGCRASWLPSVSTSDSPESWQGAVRRCTCTALCAGWSFAAEPAVQQLTSKSAAFARLEPSVMPDRTSTVCPTHEEVGPMRARVVGLGVGALAAVSTTLSTPGIAAADDYAGQKYSDVTS